jgi:hypothetical protein
MMAEQKREAGQYFSEYQHLNRQADYHGAREKLNVAIALVPKNYDYFKVKPKNNFYNNFINIFFF